MTHTDIGVVDLARERRIRSNMAELGALLQADATLAGRTRITLAGELPCPAMEVEPMADERVSMTLRVPESYLTRADDVLAKLDKLSHGPDPLGLWDSVRMSRSLVIRAALVLGLESLEEEVGIVRPVSYHAMVDSKPVKLDDPPPTTDQITSGEAATRARSKAAGLQDVAAATPRKRRVSMAPSKTVAGATLRAWRVEAGLSQAAAAERIGKAQPQWGRYERGTSTPPADVRADLEALVDDLYPDDWTTPNPDAGDE